MFDYYTPFCYDDTKEEAYKTVESLIENCTDLNIQNKEYGFTALHSAATYGRYRIVKLLLEKGANLHIQTYRGETALHKAIQNEKYKVAKLLIEKGSDINAVDSYGKTPLHYAVQRGHYNMVKLLLEKGANIHIQNYWGETALQIARRLVYLQIQSDYMYNNLIKIILLLETLVQKR
jgi:ankyrin repeat protein